MTFSSQDSQNSPSIRLLSQAVLYRLIFMAIALLYIAARLWRLTELSLV